MYTDKQIEFALDCIYDAEEAENRMQKALQQKAYEQALTHIDQGLRCCMEAEESLKKLEDKAPEDVFSEAATYWLYFSRQLRYIEKIMADPTIITRFCKKLREDLRNAPKDAKWSFTLVTVPWDREKDKSATLFAKFVFGNSKFCPTRLECRLHYTSHGVRIDNVNLINADVSWEDRWIIHMPEMVGRIEKMVLKQLKHELATESAFPTKLGEFENYL
jgi:hypothetical protein